MPEYRELSKRCTALLWKNHQSGQYKKLNIINSEHLNLIFKSCKNSKIVIFDCCILHIGSDLNFSIDEEEYRTKFLSFCYNGFSKRSKWTHNKTDMKTVMTAILNSGLKDSLNEINVRKCGVSIQEVEDLFINHSEIKITDSNTSWY